MFNIRKRAILPEQIKSILIIQFCPFGDVFLSTAYFPALKQKFPLAKIVYLVREPYQKAVLNHPYIDELLLLNRKKGLASVRKTFRITVILRKRKFDIGIDQQNKPYSTILIWLAGIRNRIGYANARLSFLYTLKAKRGEKAYSPDTRFDIVSPLGIVRQPYKLYFTIDKDAHGYINDWLQRKRLADRQMIVVSPGSPCDWKQWSEDCWVELIRILTSRDSYIVVLLWAQKELDLCQRIYDKAGDKVVLAPATNLQQALVLAGEAVLLICNDGGLNHLTVSNGAKTLAIFGGTDPSTWSPASVFSTHHHLHNPLADATDKTFGISAEAAARKALEIIEG